MLLSFFQWCYNTWTGAGIRGSTWLFPFIEAIHLLGLVMIGGTVLLVDLRLAGIALQRQRVEDLARGARPWLIGSIITMLVTGVLLMESEALRCFYSPAFWMKMIFLGLAIVFTFAIRQRVALGEIPTAPFWSKAVGIVSIILWSGVGMGGRGIAFF